jgi:hypothetical protein
MKRPILIFALMTAAPAFAQYEPSECTTTTATKCTGAAAPYAAPNAVAQPPVIVQPAPQPQYAPPPPAYYPQPNVVMLDMRKLESDGFHLVQHEDGTWWRERERSTSSPAVWGTGLAIFSASWLGSGIGSLESANGLGPLGFLPVFGAWANAIAESGRSSCTYDYSYGQSSCSDHKGAVAGWAIGGIAQAAGFTMFLVGLASGPKKVERQPVMLAPGMVGSGGGLNAFGQF